MTIIRNLLGTPIELDDLSGITVAGSPQDTDLAILEISSEEIASSNDLATRVAAGDIVFLDNQGNELTQQESQDSLDNQGSGSTPAVIIQDDGSNLTGTPHSKLNFAGAGVTLADNGSGVATLTFTGGGGGTAGDLAAVQARRSTVLNGVPLSWTDLNYDVTDFENDSAVVEHLAPGTPDRIQVKEAGTYEVRYLLTCDDEIQGRIRVNDSTVIPGSTQQSGDPNDVNNVIAAITTPVYVQLNANDFLTVQVQAATTAENIQADALFQVKKLEGAQGPQGPAGGGSSVIVEDEGVTVTGGPFTSLNFTGDGVTATDGGSGTATIDIPGGGSGKRFFLHHNGTTTQTLTGTAVTALFNTAVRADSIYSYSAGVVTINETGWYKITAEFTADSTGSRSTSEQQLVIDGSTITGTLAFGYHRQSAQGRNTVSTTWLANITSGQTVSVNYREASGTVVTEENSCRLLIEEIDAPS